MKYIIPFYSFILLTTSLNLKAQNVLDQDDVFLVDSIGNNTICFHTNMILVHPSFHSEIIENIKKGIELTSEHIAVMDVEFRVLVFPERTIPRIGMSGVAPNKDQIYILLDPNHPKFQEAISIHIAETIPHEYHHTLRYRTVGFGRNLLDAIISEGLACHFAVEVCKIDPPEYCVKYSEEMINEWISIAQKDWFNDQYDYYDWFVGRTKPKHIGYALGYYLVSKYFEGHTGETASSLYATPAESFISHMQ